MVDTRRPALVTQGFLARLAQELGPLGFEARKKALVRRVGPAWHRIELSSSHHNVPGDVTGWVSLVVTDRRVAEMAPGWRAGGPLGGPAFADAPPAGTVECSDEAAASLRCFFGRQLRAWGEDGAARRLHRVADARVRAVHEEQAKLPGPAVDDPERARRLLREVTGETRPPRRRAPEPRLFQYHVLHGPFTPLRAVES